jgi:hypothetical protein
MLKIFHYWIKKQSWIIGEHGDSSVPSKLWIFEETNKSRNLTILIINVILKFGVEFL